MDRLITWVFIAALLAIGVWSAERKRVEQEASPPTYNSPFMLCMSKTEYKAQIECLRQHGLEDMTVNEPGEPRQR